MLSLVPGSDGPLLEHPWIAVIYRNTSVNFTNVCIGNIINTKVVLTGMFKHITETII